MGNYSHHQLLLVYTTLQQIFNFLLSIPQLFKFIPCPRHRLPKYNRETDLLEPSTVEFCDKDLSRLGKLIFWAFRLVRVIRVSEKIVDDHKEKRVVHYTSTNFTIINLYLNIMGATREDRLTRNLMILQV